MGRPSSKGFAVTTCRPGRQYSVLRNTFSACSILPRSIAWTLDRKSTRLNSSHLVISYAVFCLKKKLAYQQKESTARVASIMETTNLSKQQQVSEIMRHMLTQAQTAGQYFTNDQIKEMTRTVSAEVDLVHQQTQNQRYGSSHIGATAKDISNVVIFFFYGAVATFHGIFTALAAIRN